jgi:hypothetical protein
LFPRGVSCFTLPCCHVATFILTGSHCKRLLKLRSSVLVTVEVCACSSSYSNPQPTYTMASPGQPSSQLLMLQQQQQHSQLLLAHGQPPQAQLQATYGRSPQRSSPPTGQENTTTSEDSDDSTPHSAMVSVCDSYPRLRHCSTNRKVAGSIPDEGKFLNLPTPSGRTRPWCLLSF